MPSASNSLTAVAPPALNWMPTSNIMQNGGNDAKINRIPPQYYPIEMKMLANFTRRGIREIMIFPPQKQSTCANHNNGPAAVCSYGL